MKSYFHPRLQSKHLSVAAPQTERMPLTAHTHAPTQSKAFSKPALGPNSMASIDSYQGYCRPCQPDSAADEETPGSTESRGRRRNATPATTHQVPLSMETPQFHPEVREFLAGPTVGNASGEAEKLIRSGETSTTDNNRLTSQDHDTLMRTIRQALKESIPDMESDKEPEPNRETPQPAQAPIRNSRTLSAHKTGLGRDAAKKSGCTQRKGTIKSPSPIPGRSDGKGRLSSGRKALDVGDFEEIIKHGGRYRISICSRVDGRTRIRRKEGPSPSGR